MTNREEEIRKLKAKLRELQLARLNADARRGTQIRERNELAGLRRAIGQYTTRGRFSSFVKREFALGAGSLAVAAKRAAKKYQEIHAEGQRARRRKRR